ncbi:MAG: ArsR family transcriptional regulator [Bacteroidetes bacterium]|nr:ArsR family transcriptional regulator [Bacteroidota bacterium]
MMETLITNKTRIKLLFRLFLNPDSKGYLRGLEGEFGESSNAIRIELNRFEAAGMLESYSEKNKKLFRANKKHPLYAGINDLLNKHIGIDQILEKIVRNLENVEKVFLAGPISKGLNHGPLELVIVGDKVNKTSLNLKIEKTEKSIGRSILYTIQKPVNIKAEDVRANEWLLIWDKKQVL